MLWTQKINRISEKIKKTIPLLTEVFIFLMIKCKNCGRLTKNKKFCSRKCMNEFKFRRCRKKKRSKMEVFLCQKLREDFPNLILEECNRSVLGNLELDIYFPQLGLAIEVNGQMHYRFIEHFHHTPKNFQKQRIRDLQKKIKCQELGIFLVEIPNLKSFNEKNADEIYRQLFPLIKSRVLTLLMNHHRTC